MAPISDPALAAPQTWEPDPAMLEELDEYSDVGDYRIRWPTEFKSLVTDKFTMGEPPLELSRFIQAGTLWGDGTRPAIALGVGKPPPNVGDPTPAEFNQIVEAASEQFRKAANLGADWRHTSPERGQINGMSFTRFGWQGTESHSIKMRGVFYISMTSTSVVFAMCADADAHFDETQKVMNAAMFTLKKK